MLYKRVLIITVVCWGLALMDLAVASMTFDYEIAKDNIKLLNDGNLTTVVLEGAFSASEPGYPDLPARSLTYLIPSGQRVTGIRILEADTVLLATGVRIKAKENFLNSLTILDVPVVEPPAALDPVSLYPSSILELANQGKMRGRHIASLWFHPVLYRPENGELFLINRIRFSLELDANSKGSPLGPRLSEEFEKTIKHMVLNPQEISEKVQEQQFASSSVIDFPCIIITNLQMSSAFQQLADWKTKKGFWVEIKTVESIAASYSGDSLLHKIRAYIKDVYLNKNAEWVILGGDINIIPTAVMYTMVDTSVYFNGFYPSDLYYSCLDYYWDENHDGKFGRPEAYGDTVDFYPEVFVGRLPANTLAEAQAVVTKLLNYEKNQTFTNYQTRALFTSTHFHDDPAYPILNEFLLLSEALQSKIPATFTIVERYEQPKSGLLTELNSGYGIISNYSHSACGAECFLAYNGTYPGDRQRVYYHEIGALSNSLKYGFFLNSTCANNNLLHTNATGDTVSVGRSFILNPNGGGIGYLGSTIYNRSSGAAPMHQAFFQQIFSLGEPRVGAAFAMARSINIPQVSWLDNASRLSVLSNLLLGDPQLNLWTATPKAIDIYSAPTSLYTGVRTFTVTVKSLGVAVQGALVCVYKNSDVHETRVTDASGVATFTSINFPTTGSASIVASKYDYFPDENALSIVNPPPPPPPPSCPVLFTWNGNEFEQDNTLLTASEQFGYKLDVTDQYLVRNTVAASGTTARFQIREMENEITYLKEISLIIVDHPKNSKVVCGDDDKIVVYEHTGTPISATDDQGNDILPQIQKRDSLLFISQSGGYMILKFLNPGRENFGLIVTTAQKADCPPPPSALLAGEGPISEPEVGEGLFFSEIQSTDGEWYPLSTVSSRQQPTEQLLFLDPILTGSDTITARLSWSNGYQCDFVEQVIPLSKQGMFQAVPPPEAYLSQSDGKLTSINVAAGGDVTVLRNGDFLDLTFDMPAMPDTGFKRDYVLRVAGRYEPDDQVYGILPNQFILYQNYPNPFNPSTEISFSIPSASHVSLTIYDILGRKVISLVNETMPAGNYVVLFDGQTAQGNMLSSGVYFYKLESSGMTVTRKMVLVK